MNQVKITSFEAENFKRIKAVSFTPQESGITTIGGNNRQGKTSVLDDIAYVLGGAKFAPSNPKNNDSDGESFNKITLSNGIVVERSGKNLSLKVTDPTGKRAGQELLNEFISAFALDLPKFMSASDREKAMILLETLGIKKQLTELDDREKCLYDERTEIGRVALSLDKHAKEMDFFDDAPAAEISATTIIEKQQKAVEINNRNAEFRRNLDARKNELAQWTRQLAEFDEETPKLEAEFELKKKSVHDGYSEKLNSNNQRIAQMEAEIKRIQQENGEIMARAEQSRLAMEKEEAQRRESRNQKRQNGISGIEAAKKTIADMEIQREFLPDDVDLSIFQRDIENLESENAKFRANQAHGIASAEAKGKQNEYDEYTGNIEEVRRERMALLSSVKMPLPGLTVKDAELYYNGQRWDGMSGSERLIVGASIARAVNPSCGFVLMDKLEQMDLDTLSEFGAWAIRENLQIIATRVSKGEECSFIIEDGMVVSE